MSIFVDVDYSSVNKYKEELCGDKVEVLRNQDSVIVVLTDGLGSGVKANILATLTSKMIGTMLSLGASIDETVEAVINTLPVSKERGIAYSSFSVLQIYYSGECILFEFDNPSVIRLAKGNFMDMKKKCHNINGKTINESKFKVSPDDLLILISDGAVRAGIGNSLDIGWQWENVKKYACKIYRKDISAKNITKLLLSVCDNLYEKKPGDDTTVVTVKIKSLLQVNVMIGPPADRSLDSSVINRFLSEKGKKIVCGGTTAQIVSRETGKEIITSINYIDHSIPPTAKIEGIDLTTEGILTMGKALEYARRYASSENTVEDILNIEKEDGASKLTKLLVEESTSVHFFVGCAKNPAHQNPDLPLSLSLKLQLVEDMANCLKSLDKEVIIEYY